MRKHIMISTILFALLIFKTNVPSSSAQTNSINKIQLNKKIDSLFKEFNNTSSPGYAITISQNGKVIWLMHHRFDKVNWSKV